MSNDFECKAMLGNLITKLRETKTNVEATAWIFAQTVEIIKGIPDVEPTTTQVDKAPAPAQVTHDRATGPDVQEWVAPKGGYYTFDGRFIKDKTWRPVEKSVVEERAPSVPDVLTAIQSGVRLGSDKRMVSAEAAEARAKDQIVFVPKAKLQTVTDKPVPRRNDTDERN